MLHLLCRTAFDHEVLDNISHNNDQTFQKNNSKYQVFYRLSVEIVENVEKLAGKQAGRLVGTFPGSMYYVLYCTVLYSTYAGELSSCGDVLS